MLIPSIDLMNGAAVQLVGGKEMAIDAGDPRPILERFGRVGEVAVIDLDSALGKGSNETTIRDLVRRGRCRVGGGIRDLETAIKWLDAGASKIIIGTKATPELLSQLPRERVIAALDARDGEVVVEGWQTGTGRGIMERMQELNPYVSGYLVTFVEREGRMGGTNLDRVGELVAAAGGARVTIAGGVTTAEDIRVLDRLGADAQVGMALYSGSLKLGDAFAAPLTSDRPDGLWPTVVVDEHGVALGLVYSNQESVSAAIESGCGVYHSRKRGLWQKGESSGAVQQLVRIDMDCDRDALRFTVRQAGAGFCHEGSWSCWGEVDGLPALARTLESRKQSAPAGSYTARLFGDSELLAAKLREEAEELNAAENPDHVAQEAADVFYFTLVRMLRDGVPLADVEAILSQRSKRFTRRAGDAKAR